LVLLAQYTDDSDFYTSKNKDHTYLIDASIVKSPLGCDIAGKNPTDRRKLGIKRSIITDFKGAPLGIICGGANQHDSKFFKETYHSTKKYFDYQKLNIMQGDSAYDSKEIKNFLKRDGFVPFIATNKRRNKIKNLQKLFKNKRNSKMNKVMHHGF